MKLKRNRKRRQKKRREAAEFRNKSGERFKQAEREADGWIAREAAKESARIKMEKLHQLSEKKAKAEKLQLEEELELALVVEKLQELRALRVEKLTKQGCLFPEEDDEFMERVRAAVEEEEEERQAAAALAAPGDKIDEESSSALVQQSGSSMAQAADQAAPVETPSSTKAGGMRQACTRRDLPAKFADYYDGSSGDMGGLVEVRRSWDIYLTSSGGSRIPGHWVQPSPPSNHVWASCLPFLGAGACDPRNRSWQSLLLQRLTADGNESLF